MSHICAAPGQKLPLKDDSNTPNEWRSAFKIMDDHDVLPEWIAAGKRLEKMEAKLRSQINARAQGHVRELRKAEAAGMPAPPARSESKWNRYKEDYLKRIERYNQEVLLYNLILPAGIRHRQTMRGEALIKQALQND